MLTPADELPHPPPQPLPDRWQENYFLLGWDEQSRAGLYLHLARLPVAGTIDVKAAALLGGTVAAAATELPLGPGLGGPGVDVVVEEPFRRWRLGVALAGSTQRGPNGMLSTADDGVSLGFDVQIESTLPPIDWREALATLGAPGTERDHYEVACTWSGEVRVGSERIDASGLMIRDHTWGPRSYDEFRRAWWTACCFDEARVYFTGVSVDTGERWTGVSILVEEGADPVLIPDHRVVLGDASATTGYDTSVIEASAAGHSVSIAASTVAHLPIEYPEMSEGFTLNDAFSTLEMGTHRGFGSVELARSAADARPREGVR